jgi:signal transduction histidine kinase
VRLTRLRCGRSVRLECRLGESLPRIDGSPQLLGQALLNLLVNACQAVEDATEPHVCIETAAEGEGALIRVRDRGHGIPEAARPHVFEPFFATREGRTGLGLSIARDIVEDHAGSVELEGCTDGWTTFAVRLPAPGS